jgi:DNA-binding response OmpR family regulator
VHRFADVSFDSATRTTSRNGAPIDLTPREAGLFEALIRAAPAIVVRDALAENMYEDVSGNALEATVSRLRRKLTAAGSALRVETLRGIGYRLAE